MFQHSLIYLLFKLYWWILIWKQTWDSSEVVFFLPCNLLFCELSKCLSWTKAPSQHAANGLTKRDQHPPPRLHTTTAHYTCFAWKTVWPLCFPWISESTLLSTLFHSPLLFIVKVMLQPLIHIWPKYPFLSHPPPTSYQTFALLLPCLLFSFVFSISVVNL